MRTRCYVALSCLIALVCAVAPRAADAGSRPLDFEVLLLGAANLPAGDYVFRDEESWIAFCDAASAFFCPGIDFRHETVIASVAGPQPSSCFGIRIDAIERFPGRAIEVGVTHTEPFSDRCVCTPVSTQPVIAVVVSGPIGTAEFVHEVVQAGCGPCGFVDGQVHAQCGIAIP